MGAHFALFSVFGELENRSFTCMGAHSIILSVFGELENRSFTCMGSQLCYFVCFS